MNIVDTAWITKEEAFRKRKYDKNIELDRTQHVFQFTRKWFRDRNQVTYSTFLARRYRANRSYNHIQIGVFEGMDLVWLMQNCFGHRKSRVVAMDPWLPNKKLTKEAMRAIRARAHNNLWPWANKIKLFPESSTDVLPRLKDGITIRGKEILPGQWHSAVIDGDHRGRTVYTDALSVLELLAPGGWMLFDDVRMNKFAKGEVPHGLDYFLRRHGDRVKLITAHRVCNIYEKL